MPQFLVFAKGIAKDLNQLGLSELQRQKIIDHIKYDLPITIQDVRSRILNLIITYEMLTETQALEYVGSLKEILDGYEFSERDIKQDV